MPQWFTRAKEQPVEKEDDIEIKPSKEFEDRLGKIDALEASLNDIKSKTAVLDRMTSFLDEQEEARRANKAREMAERASKTTEDLDTKWVTDPQNAFRESVSPLVTAQTNTSSLLMRREIFDDGVDFEYYHGDFKKTVDALIDSGSLAQKIDPNFIKNCYYTAIGRRQKDINDGKLKSRFASASSAASGTGAPGIESKKTISLTEEQKRAARVFGMTEEQYAQEVETMNYV